MRILAGLLAVIGALSVMASDNSDPSAAERGRKALTSKAFSGGIWLPSDYDGVWKAWGLKEKPADFDRLYRERYGLHPAPYENHGLPMGLR